MPLPYFSPPSLIYRLGRRPDPWRPPDWAHAGPDGTFGNRFDDPQGLYRVLYASSRKLGCFLETLARFRLYPKPLVEQNSVRSVLKISMPPRCFWQRPGHLTQRAARVAFEAGFDSVHYRSRYGHDASNWCLELGAL
ncbi:MAG: RES family NAD+ phosphorylase [Bryobacteraceae bacterium]|nr:RES family NAD+ phosphorylase [Bryobacteraceae bacterium]